MNTIINGFYVLVSRAFGKYSINHLVMFLGNVVAMVTKNPAFPAPTPTVADMSKILADLDAKAQAAMNGGKVELAARGAAQITALTAARQWANYVEANCAGSLETLLSSGFEARKAPTPPAMPSTPSNARLGYTKLSGELLLRYTGSTNAKNFSVQYAENSDGPWIDQPLKSSRSVLIGGLTPGKLYWARVRANATAGSSDWCPPTCKMAI